MLWGLLFFCGTDLAAEAGPIASRSGWAPIPGWYGYGIAATAPTAWPVTKSSCSTATILVTGAASAPC